MYKRILVPLDGSPAAECVLPHVQQFARQLGDEPGPEVIVLRVFEPRVRKLLLDPAQSLRAGAAAIDQAELERARDYLLGIRARLEGQGISVQARLLQGSAERAILQAIEELEIDLVIFAGRGQVSVREALFGSVGTALLGRHHRALNLVVPPGDAAPNTDIRSIVVPLDGSPFSEHVMPRAERLARVHQASITLVRVVNLRYSDKVEVLDDLPSDEDVTGQETLFSKLERDHTVQYVRDARAYLARWSKKLSAAGTTTYTTLLHGPVAESIARAGKDANADMVVMTSHGRSAISRVLYGGVALEVLRLLGRPVLIAHPPADS